MNRPKYLYHYTNIDTLALILKNRTIKFSSLVNVDDLDEAKTKDLGDFGKYCFVSCWTEEDEESIPFWHIYTNNMKGVRIKLPSDMFKKYTLNNIGSEGSFDSYFTLEEITGHNYMISPNWTDILSPIEYTNNTELLYPKILYKTDYKIKLETEKIGKYKRNHWSFQKEWRYILKILPISYQEFANNEFDKLMDRIYSNLNLDISSYFLNINDEAFSQMEITLGPNTTEGDKIIVESLLNTYNKSAKIHFSNLSKTINIK